MHSSVEKLVNELRGEIADLKKAEKDAYLQSLNLTEEKKVYLEEGAKVVTFSPLGLGLQQKKEVIDGVERYYHIEKKPVEISDEDYLLLRSLISERDQLKSSKQSKEPQEPPFQIEMSATPNSPSATFLKVIAWVTWIGGFILALLASAYETRSGTAYDATVFATTFGTYAMCGALIMCGAELFRNIKGILDALLSIQFKKNNR